ncbi:MAG TPA: hypothetical protein VJP87_10880 [Candidatus Acidoferrales bacterium]|nr:hypothetical protein [Candidatus Acidoferrales bacterium]
MRRAVIQTLANGAMGFAAVLFACSVPVLAQDQQQGSSQQSSSSDAKPAGRTGAVGVVQTGEGGDISPTNGAPPIQELGRGNWLANTVSPLHWGSLSIGSFDLTEGYNDFNSSATNSLNGVFHTTFLSTSVIFSPRLSRTNLAFQWHPQVGFINGHFVNNLSNQDVSFEVSTSLTSRLSVRFMDHFSYVPAQNVFSEGFLYGAETRQNNSVQSPFLDGPGNWLTNTALATIAYAINPTTDLEVTPSFNYTHLLSNSSALGQTVGIPTGVALIGGRDYNGTVNLRHRLSPLKTVGIYYSLDAVKFETTPSYSTYNTIGGSYSQQLSPTWFMTLTAGASTAAFNANGPKTWSFSGSAQLQKRFRSSSLSLAYSRGLSIDRYVTRNFTDRVDASYNTQLTRRFSAQLGFGYQRVDGPPLIFGKYASPQLSYQLLPSLSLLATYVYLDQSGDTTQVFTEVRHTGFITLSWTPFHLKR